MIKPLAIDKNTGQQPALNFEFLRSRGIELIQQLAGKSWTDFNLHDPGVTILEQLCFAITELAYRTDFPIEDLLANEKGIIDYEKNAFFLKEDILTTNPVTLKDYRKALIDQIDEVQNIWLYPLKSVYSEGALSGLYKIFVQVKPDIAQKMLTDGETISTQLSDTVRRNFVAMRNLCEDVVHDIVVLRPIRITLEAEILVAEQHIPEEVLANVYHHLESALNMPVRYFAENELLEQGFTIDEIYSGPLLRKGFIPNRELGDRKLVVDPTELIKSLSQIDGILSVKRLKIIHGNQSRLNKPFVLPENTFPLLDIVASEQHIKLFRDNFELPIKRPVFRLIIQKLRENHNRSYLSSFLNKTGRKLIKGKYHNNERYFSIQNHFPKIYGIGPEGLLNKAPKQRKAQAKQLKAYLLFFEQMMANYLSQLANVSDVFSTDTSLKGGQTYHKMPLYDVPDVKPLFKEFTTKSPGMSDSAWETFKRNKNNAYVTTLDQVSEPDQVFVERKNRLFEHFLARFNEFVTIYPVELHSGLYEPDGAEERINAELRWKSKILKNIPEIGYNRIKAANYFEPDTEVEMDFAKKMRLLLNIKDPDAGSVLTSVFDNDAVSVESGKKPERDTENFTDDISEDDIAWQGEMPKILISKAELDELFDTGRVISSDEIPHDAFLIRRQEVSILKYALDVKNYRIGPNPSKDGGYILLYKAPQDDRWITISRFPGHGEAMQAVRDMIGYIRDINIDSEGFYILEHILLRPDLDGNNFGFRFIAKNGQKLMEHSKWLSYDDREDAIASLLGILEDKNDITSEKLAPYCRINLYAPTSAVPESVHMNKDRDDGKNIFNYFKFYAAQREKFLSRFEMVIRGDDNSMIREDFFSLRMSVVLPTWPARFQDKNFRDALESLFRLNSPAHVKINFLWMNVNNLRKFESIYFDWRKFMAGGTDKETRNELRNALVQMLDKF